MPLLKLKLGRLLNLQDPYENKYVQNSYYKINKSKFMLYCCKVF